MTNQTTKVTPQVATLAGMFPLGISPRRDTVCDGCLTAAYDEGAGDQEDQQIICREMGADIADHLCDAREELGMPTCACACNQDA